MRETLQLALKRHERWRAEQCLNLIPSENVTSPAVRRILGSDLGHRYTAVDHFYLGSKYTDLVEDMAGRLACEVFGAEWVDVSPLSGHLTDMTLLSTFARQGDKIMTVGTDNGGYPGISEVGYPKILGLQNLYLPFDRETWNIQTDLATGLIVCEKPKLVVAGASFILFPRPLEQLAKACHEAGATLAYDGSHVLGLIAGGAFQQPLREGARVLLGSTHKTFFGPQGGIIMSFKPEGEQMKRTIFPSLVDNSHWNRIAGLGQALLEARRFGRQYARQIVRNSRALAEALDEAGVPVRCREYGYTASHQVLLDMGRLRDGYKVPERLQEANVIVDRGIRLGTSEVTRRGMREKEMNEVAEIISSTILGKKPARVAKKQAVGLARRFGQVRYA